MSNRKALTLEQKVALTKDNQNGSGLSVRQLAEKYGVSKTSNGWFEKFRIRHAISFRTISGESASIDDSTIEEWKKRIPIILSGYDAKDVFNADETGLFYRATHDRSLVLSKEEYKGGRSSRPRCFKNIVTSKLPVTWLGNRTAWMNCVLFVDWLTDINNYMKRNNRKILLFLDNAPCHVVNQDLSNIKLAFFPPNTTSKCQPLDQGVIRSFKCYYRQKLVKHIIAQCTLAQTVDQISITALDAIKWIDLSWKNVTQSIINNGFRAAGFDKSYGTSSFSTIDTDVITENESQPNNVDCSLQQLDSLLAHIHIGGQQLTAAEFVDIDSCIPTFNEWNDDDHLKGLIEASQEEENEEEEEEMSLIESPPNLVEALESLRKLHLFASTQQPQLHSLISELESQLTDIYIDSKSSKQSFIKDYFSTC